MSDSKLYTKNHEWIQKDGDIYLFGITNYAQEQLGDCVFVELPKAGTTFKGGDVMGVIESVKTVADFYCPCDCEIVEVNNAVEDAPELLNDTSEGSVWMLKLKITGDTGELMKEEDYKKTLDN